MVLAILTFYLGGVTVVGRAEDRGDGNYQVEFGTLSAPHHKLRSLSMGPCKGSKSLCSMW